MIISLFLAKFLGLYMLIVSLAILVRRHFFITVIREYAASHAYMYVTGFLAVFVGLLIVLAHNIWVVNWFVLITIIGWLFLLKGLARIFFPEYCGKLLNKWSNHPYFLTVVAILTLLISLYLIYFGFTW